MASFVCRAERNSRAIKFIFLAAALVLPRCVFAAVQTSTTLAIAPPVPLGSGIYQGTVLTATATVTDSNGAVGLGTVNFCFAGVSSCTPSNRLATAQLLSSGSSKGMATVHVRLASGTRSLQAFFAGTATETSSISTAVSIKIASHGGFGSTTVLSAAPSGSAYIFSAQVTATGSAAPTGAVSLLDASNASYSLGSVGLGATTLSYGFGALTPKGTVGAAAATPVAIGDFNGDGEPDVAYISSAGVPTLYFGDGTGAFPTSATLPLSSATALAAADFNADGVLDLAVTTSDGNLHIFLGSGNGTFTVGQTYPVGTGPTRVLAADFNADGIFDLAVSNSTAGTVSVYTGTGAGGFIALTTLPVGGTTADLVSADFDGNGYGDLAVALTGSNTVMVYLGSVSGGNFIFTPATPVLLTGTSTGALAAADFNGDGKTDLAAGTSTGVVMIPGLGGGTFNVAASTIYPLASPATLLHTYDFNSDGFADLFVTSGSNEVVLLGGSSGTLTLLAPTGTFSLGANIAAVALADINGDAIRDLVTLSIASPGSIGLAPGQLNYTAGVTSPGLIVPGFGTHQIEAAYNGDSTYAGSTSLPVGVTAVPTATTTTLTSSPSTGRAAIGSSLALTTTVSPSTIGAEVLTGSVTFYDGATALSPAVAPGASGTAVYAISALGSGNHSYTAVYNGDPNFLAGPPTAAVSIFSAYASSVTLATSPATTTVSTSVITLTASLATLNGGPAVQGGSVTFCTALPCTGGAVLGSAQVNATNATASVKVHLEPGSYSLYASYSGTMNIVGSVSSPVALQVKLAAPVSDGLVLSATNLGTATPQPIELGGLLSAASLQTPTGTLHFVDTTNSNFGLGNATLGTYTNSFLVADAVHTIGAGNSPSAIQVADVNADGYPDLIVTNAADSTVSILLNNGSGSFTVGSTVPVGSNPYAIAVGDFNGDGHLDLAIANALGNSISILLGDGAGHFTSAGSAIAAGFTPTAIVAADFNLDGHLDLAVANYFNGSVTLLYGDGHGGFTAGPVLTLPDGAFPLMLATADLNGDNFPDLIVPDSSGALNIYINTLSGLPSLPTSSKSVGGSPISLAVGDLDGDGAPDLVYADLSGSTIGIFYGDGTGNFPASPVLIAVGSAPNAVALADVNGDGREDIEAATSSPNQMAVLVNSGSRTYAPVVDFPLGGSPLAMTSGDFALNGLTGFGILSSGASSVDIASVQYAMTDQAGVSPITVYGGGTHQLQASYAGDSIFAPATSALVAVQGNLIPTTLTLGFTGNAVVGAQVTLVATVSPTTFDNYTASGTVTFKSNGTTICSAVPLASNGTASCAAAALTAIGYTFAVSYSGDTNFQSSTQTLLVTVPKVTPVITWPTPAAITYGTAISATQLDATVSPAIAGALSYSVTASTVLQPGTYTLTVTFAPTDTTDYTQATQQVQLVVNPISPTLSWPTPAAIAYGTALSATQLDAALTSSPAIPGSISYSPALGAVLSAGPQTLKATFTPSGPNAADYAVVTQTISLTVNKVPLTVTANSYTIALGATVPALGATITGFVNNDTMVTAVTGTPSLTLTPLAPTAANTYPITAALGTLAAANYSFSFVNGTLVIQPGTDGLTLSAPASVTLGTAITMTATLSTSASVVPGGSIAFYDGGTNLLGTVPVTGRGKYTLPATLTPGGNHTLTATYSGDANYPQAPSNAQVVDVIAPSYTLSTTPSTLTLQAGQTGLVALTVTPVGGFTGTVNFSCTGLPNWASCTFNPGSLTATSSAPVSSQMTIVTLGSATGTVAMLRDGRAPAGLALAAVGIPSLLLGLAVTRRRRRSRRLACLMLALLVGAFMFTVSGCGSGGINCCSVPNSNSGTYSVIISGAGASVGTQTTTFTLKVE
jgi:hypothetical protein